MLRKSWKHLSLIMRILFFIAIGGAICSLGCDGTQKNKDPVKIYRVTEPEKKDTPGTVNSLSSIKDDAHSDSSHQEDTETTDTHTSTDAFSDNSDPNATSDEPAQQGYSSDLTEQSDEELANKSTEQEQAEVQAEIHRVKTSLREQQNKLESVVEKYNTVKKDIDQRYYALAEKLNSLSAEEQRAYFEEEYLSGKAIAEEFMSAFFERLNTEGAARGYSEQIEKLIEGIKQAIPETTDEEMINQHIQKLRKYGFEPKF